MAETIAIECPECERPMKAPADSVGKKIRCKGCDHAFIIKEPKTRGSAKGKGEAAKKKPLETKKGTPPKEEVKKKPAGDDDEENADPYGVTDLDLAPRCPHCANEMEDEEAIVCLHCGYNTQTRIMGRTRKVIDQTGGDIFLWLLPGILAVIGVFVILGYCLWHYLGLPGVLIDDWETISADKTRVEALKSEKVSFGEAALCHPGVVVWFFVAGIYASYKLGRFAFIRLVYENTPPEVEKEK